MKKSFLVHDLETITDPSLPLPSPKTCQEHLSFAIPSFIAENENQSVHPREGEVCGVQLFDRSGLICPSCNIPPQPFLPASYHRIVCIGYAQVTSDFKIEGIEIIKTYSEDSGAEAKGLTTVFEYLESLNPTLVGWNSRRFDVPVLAARGFLHGIPFPWYYKKPRQGDPRYRYDEDGHYDLKAYLSDYGACSPASLDVFAKSMGLPGKVGIDGSMVAQMVREGRISEVESYCACDVAQTTGVLFRTELLRGRISREEYQEAAYGLVLEIERNVLLSPLRDRIEMDRFMLTERSSLGESK